MARSRGGAGEAGDLRFRNRYGAWALVAGASEGLGAAYAKALAGRGMNLVLAARRAEPLEALAEDLRGGLGVEVRTLAGDLASPDFPARLALEAAELDLGVLVYNAAHAPAGDFAEAGLADLARVVDVNVRAPVALLGAVLPRMAARGRGAVILMSSLAGNQGSPHLAAYAASKAFNRVLAEGLWRELRDRGVDVLACCPGAVRTPGYASASAGEAPGTLDPEFVAERTLRALGRGPLAIPGLLNLIAFWLTGRVLPRRAAIGLMARSTRDLARAAGRKG
ncbi:MAG: SDR family NAD(P)-dependent oxidoreductase [Treponema sp.]|nr:SDR family NAD(P)-dependent oxidoreductase [Treponema sp.]